MQKQPDRPDVEATRSLLRAFGRGRKQAQIADATGVNQGQVSRLLRGQFKRISPNVRRLCDYANMHNEGVWPDQATMATEEHRLRAELYAVVARMVELQLRLRGTERR